MSDRSDEVRTDILVVAVCVVVMLGVIALTGCAGAEAVKNVQWQVTTSGDVVRVEGGVGSRSEFYTYVEVDGAEGSAQSINPDDDPDNPDSE